MSASGLTLIRHAEAQCNVANVWAGHEDGGLTRRGLKQATALADRLGCDPRFTGTYLRLVVSAMSRAGQTASRLQPALASRPFAVDCALCERHPGVLSGLSNELVRAGGLYESDSPGPEGGESVLVFFRRACRALRRLAASAKGDELLVVTHTGVIAASRMVFGGDKHSPFDEVPPHASLTRWVFPERQGEPCRLEVFGDVSHLR